MFVTFERLPSERSPCLRVIEIIVISVISILIHCICILLSLFMMVDSMQQTTTKEKKYFFKQKIKNKSCLYNYCIVVLLVYRVQCLTWSRRWCAVCYRVQWYKVQPAAARVRVLNSSSVCYQYSTLSRLMVPQFFRNKKYS